MNTKVNYTHIKSYFVHIHSFVKYDIEELEEFG